MRPGHRERRRGRRAASGLEESAPSIDPALALTAPCDDCGAAEVTMHLGDRALCDRCFDRRIATATGLPRLPEPPGPEVRIGPDGRAHHFRFRLWRAPGGIVAEASEEGPFGSGYHAKVVGPHDADADDLLSDLETRLARQVGRLDLERHPGHDGWTMSGSDLRGRLEWADDSSGPYDVVVDGRRFSWHEFGRLLEPFEGWEFRLTFEPAEVDGDP